MNSNNVLSLLCGKCWPVCYTCAYNRHTYTDPSRMHENLLGLGVMGVYHITIIIIKILKKRILVDRILHFCPIPIIFWMAIDGPIWLCWVWLLPYRTYSFWRLWNVHVQLKWRHSKWCQAFPSSKLLKLDAYTHSKTEGTPFLKPTEYR